MKKIRTKRKFSMIEILIVLVVLCLLLWTQQDRFKEINKEYTTSSDGTTINKDTIQDFKLDTTMDHVQSDKDSLCYAIQAYVLEKDELPVKDISNVVKSDNFSKQLEKNDDDYSFLRELDFNKLGKYKPILTYGNQNKVGERYLYSVKTQKIYYEKGVILKDKTTQY